MVNSIVSEGVDALSIKSLFVLPHNIVPVIFLVHQYLKYFTIAIAVCPKHHNTPKPYTLSIIKPIPSTPTTLYFYALSYWNQNLDMSQMLVGYNCQSLKLKVYEKNVPVLFILLHKFIKLLIKSSCVRSFFVKSLFISIIIRSF